MKQTENKGRRNFLKVLAAATGIGFIPLISRKSGEDPSEKIKMLTADGKLVEVKKSKVEREITSTRATDQQVLDWMKSKDQQLS